MKSSLYKILGVGISLAWTSMGTVMPAHALDIPVMVDVVPPGGGPAAPQTIGTIVVSTGAAGAPPLTGSFTLAAQYDWLDDWYDFRWINLVTAGPSPGGPLPAIDPQIGQIAPGQLPNNLGDDRPYYFNEGNWTANNPAGTHVERTGTIFTDAKGGHPNETVITFNTYLVADDVTAGGFPNQQFCILAGFSWTYNQNTQPANPPAIVIGALIPLPGTSVADITTALANAAGAGGGGVFPSPVGAIPAGDAWEPITGCTLSNCCGNNVREGGEECDGADDAACVAQCQADCTCPPPAGCGDGNCGGGENCFTCPSDCGVCPDPCPAMSTWGAVVLTCLILTAATIMLRKQQRETRYEG